MATDMALESNRNLLYALLISIANDGEKDTKEQRAFLKARLNLSLSVCDLIIEEYASRIAWLFAHGKTENKLYGTVIHCVGRMNSFKELRKLIAEFNVKKTSCKVFRNIFPRGVYNLNNLHL